MQRLFAYFQQEPEKVFFVIRALVATALALGVGIREEILEPLLGVLAVLLGADYAATRFTDKKLYSGDEAKELVDLAAQAQAVPRPLWDFVESTVSKLIPASEVPFAMAKMAGDLVAFFERQLDAGTRAEILTFVHSKLRQLGYLKVKSFPDKKAATSIVLLLVVLLVAGCAPVANYFLGDEARLEFAETGFLFAPGASTAYEVLVDIQGQDVAYLGETTWCEPMDLGLRCEREVVEEPWLIELTGLNVSGIARYSRAPGGRIFTTIAN